MNLRREGIDIQGSETLFSFTIEYCFLEMFKVLLFPSLATN
jgi:hypothetical protein